MSVRAMLWMVLLALLASGGRTLAEEPPVLKVGHVGHDHQIALFIACDLGEALSSASGGVWLEMLKDRQVYLLRQGEKTLAQVMLTEVRGGAGMPAALAAGEIDVGLGGFVPTAIAIDKGAKLRIVAPLNSDGDMLMVRPDFVATDWPTFVETVRTSPTPVRIGHKAPRAVALMIFQRALAEAKLRYGNQPVGADGQPNHVVLVDCKGGDKMIPALVSGSVDGMVMNQPTIAVAEGKGVGRVIADLSGLPPQGMWQNHPCCVVAATETTIREHRAVLVALLQTVVAGGRAVVSDREQAVTTTSRWTKIHSEVEAKSIATVTYVPVFDEHWERGVGTWLSVMRDMGEFSRGLKDLETQAVAERIVDAGPLAEALQAMPAAAEQPSAP